MIINNNISALNSYRNLTSVNERVSKSLEKLSSGLRINKAGDDAAGLAISEKMRGQINGLNMATKNAQDGISLIQTGEGALNETHAILQRMREVSVQSANDTNTTTDRRELQKEMDRLRQEVDRIAETTEFNTKVLMKGKFGETQNDGINDGLKFHIGANENQFVSLKFDDMGSKALKITGVEEKQVEVQSTDDKGKTVTKTVTTTVQTEDTAVSITSAMGAERAITIINNAIERVSAERSKYGAMQNRLEHTINNLRTASENLQSAESRIRDADMATEMMGLSKDKIIAQSGTAMLAQANTTPQGVLQLLR